MLYWLDGTLVPVYNQRKIRRKNICYALQQLHAKSIRIGQHGAGLPVTYLLLKMACFGAEGNRFTILGLCKWKCREDHT